jgi:hypothetical protein
MIAPEEMWLRAPQALLPHKGPSTPVPGPVPLHLG